MKISETASRFLALIESAFNDKWEKVEFFLDDVQNLSWDLESKYEASVKASYEEATDSIVLSYIGVEEPGRGVGSKIMSELCAYADKHKLNIKLHANGGFGTPIDRLIGFYNRYGFVRNGSLVKGIGVPMIRRYKR